MAIALDIIKNKTGLSDELAQEALNVKNAQGAQAFKDFVNKNKVSATAPVTGVTVDENGNISNTTGKKQKIKNLGGQEFYVGPDEAQRQQAFGTPGYGQYPAQTGEMVTGVNGEKFLKAPVDPTTGLSAPQQPTVQPVVPTTPVQPVDKTPGITQTEFQKAQAESEKIKAQNEAQMALNKQSSELRMSETAKANEAKTAEAQKLKQEQEAQLANSETAILNTLRSGGIIPESVKTSPYYKTAQATYNKLQQFSTYSTSDLTTALNTGALLPGTSVYNEMLKDPAMKAKLQQAQMYTVGQPVDTNQVFTQVSNEILSNNPTTASYLADGVITQEEYNQATNNAEVVAKAKDVEEKTNKYNTLKAEYDAIREDVIRNFPGSPYVEDIIADRQKAKYKNLVLTKGEVDSAVGTLTEIKSQASALFETNLKLYETRRAEQAAREQAVFETNLGLQAKQKEAEMAQQLAREAMNDPYTAIPQLVAQYQELGIPFERSVQQIIQDFEGSGQDLATYLTGLQKTIQSKPEFQAMQAYQMRQYAPPAEKAMEYGFSNIGDGRIAITNPKTGQVSFASAGSVSSANAPTNSSAKYLDIPTGTDVGVQCGQFARTLCGMDATPGGNSLEARKKAYVDTTPVAGGMVLFTGSGYDKTYGHIAAIESVNPDGTINIVESNLKNDNRVTRRTIPANDPAIHGFYNDTPLAKQSTGTQYTDSDIELLAELANMDASARNTALKAQGIPLKAVTDYMAQAKAGKIPATASQKQSATQIIGNIKDLASMDWNDATGVNFSMMDEAPAGSDWATAQSKINNLVASITLPNLGMLKGPMSDKDLAFIQNASSKLAMTQSDAEFEKQLVELYNISANKAGLPTITKLSDIKGGNQVTVGGEDPNL